MVIFPACFRLVEIYIYIFLITVYNVNKSGLPHFSHKIAISVFLYVPAFLYRRHREKLQAHFSDSRSLRDCGVNASGLMSKSTPRLQYSFQLQKVNLYVLLIYFQSYLYHHYHLFHLNMRSTSLKTEFKVLDRMMYDVCLNNISTGRSSLFTLISDMD